MDPLISPNEFKVIKECRTLPTPYCEFGKSDREIIDNLCSLGYLKDNGGLVFITEAGNAIVNSRFRSALKTWIPIVVSSGSLIISIIALLAK